MQVNTRKNAFDALFYLVWVIIKQKWMFILGIVIVTMLFIPIPRIIVNNSGADYNAQYGVLGLIMMIPTISITLILLPITHEQIYSSSIKKRLDASGVSSKIYAIVMIVFFSLISILIFYISIFCVFVLFNNSTYFWYDYDPVTGEDIIIKKIWYVVSPSYWSIFLFGPIAIFGFSSTGLLIGKIKLNELIKGIAVFIFIIIVILMSRTILTPYNSDFSFNGAESVNRINNIMFLNPWGTMLWTTELSIMNDFFMRIHSGLNQVGDLHRVEISSLNAFMYSTIWTVILFNVAIFIA